MEAIWSFRKPFQLKVIIDAHKQALESDNPRSCGKTRAGERRHGGL